MPVNFVDHSKSLPAIAQTELPKITESEFVDDYWKKLECIKTESDALSLMNAITGFDIRLRFLIGGVLQRVKEEKLHKPFSLKEWAEVKLGFSPRRSQYCMQVFNNYPPKKIELIDYFRLSFTKWRVMFPVLHADQYAEWIEKAEKMTVAELKAALDGYEVENTKAQSLLESMGPSVEPAAEEQWIKFECSVNNEYMEVINLAFSECMSNAGTDSKGMCFYYICQEYLSGAGEPGQTKIPTISDLCNREIKKQKGNNQKALLSVIEQVSQIFPQVSQQLKGLSIMMK